MLFFIMIIVLCTSTNNVKQMIENLHARVQVEWKILLALRKKYMHLCKCACVKSSSAQYQKIVFATILKQIFFKYFTLLIYMFSYFEPNFIEKLLKLEKCFLRNKNWLFGRHFETVQPQFFSPELWFLIVHTYGPKLQISLQNFIGKVFF